MILTLVIFTVVVLVYSIGEKAAVPRDAAVAFAGIVFGVSGLWLLGHLVMYCRGAQAVTPPPLAMPLPLTGIATGVGATTMAMPQAQVPQAAVDVVVPPAVHLHQPQQQQHQRVYRPQNNQYQEYQPPQGFPPQLQLHSQPQDQSYRQVLSPQQEQQNRQHGDRQRGQQAEAQAPVQYKQEEQRKQESHQRLTDHEPYVKEPPYPESPPGAYQGGPQEEPKKLAQQRKDQRRQQQVEKQQQGREISGPLENVWKKRPGVPENQPAPVTVPGPVQQRQQPKGPRTMIGKPPEPPERVSSLRNSVPETSSRRQRSSSLSSSRVNRPDQLSRGASNLPRPARGSRSGDASKVIDERGRSRVDRSRPDQHQDIEPEPRSASIRSTSLDSATRASLKVNAARENCESPSWADSDQPAPLNIAQGDRPPLGDEISIEGSRATENHACLVSRRSDRLESEPLIRGARGQTVAKNRGPTIREVAPTPPNEPATPIQPAQGEVRDQSIRADASSSSSPSRPPPSSPALSARGSKTFDEMGIPPGRELTLYENARQSVSDFGNFMRRSFTDSRASDSDSRGKPRSLMTDFQTNVFFMPDYNFTGTQPLDHTSHEYGTLPFLGHCEGDEEKVASGEELEDRGDVVMVCSSDDAGQWLIKLVELTESPNETDSDVAK